MIEESFRGIEMVLARVCDCDCERVGSSVVPLLFGLPSLTTRQKSVLEKLAYVHSTMSKI